VKKLQEEKKEYEKEMAESLVHVDALAGALSTSKAELSRAKVQVQGQGPSPPGQAGPQVDMLSTPEYRLLVLKNQMLNQALEMVTSSESSLKSQVIELKEEKNELKADMKAERELHRASQKEWSARESRWNDKRSSTNSSSASGSGTPATASSQIGETYVKCRKCSNVHVSGTSCDQCAILFEHS
jgi:hypothetical protein